MISSQAIIRNKLSVKLEPLQAVLVNTVDNKKIFGVIFVIKHNQEIWHGTAGKIKTAQPCFIASTTKLVHFCYHLTSAVKRQIVT